MDRLRRKYAVHPGPVFSKDGDEHFVGFDELIRLYGVPADECLMWDDSRPQTFVGLRGEDYLHLYPKGDWNYKSIRKMLAKLR